MGEKELEENYEYKHLIVKEYKYWRIELFSNQAYLGRCIIMHNNGRLIYDLFDTSADEFAELYYVAQTLRNALKKLFKPDMFNYASMGNVMHRLHVHVFPRYSKAVEFGGVIFKDNNWGAKPYPYDDVFEITPELTQSLIKAIRKELDRTKLQIQ